MDKQNKLKNKKAQSPIMMATITIMLFLTNCDDFAFKACSDCQIEHKGSCTPDSVNYKCPPGAVHADYYEYSSWSDHPCSCVCKAGWMGANCDQRDTSFYIRFSYGADTMMLSELLSTNNYIQVDSLTPDYEGYFPAGSGIDTFRIRMRLPFAIQPPYSSVPICQTDSVCTYLEIVLSSGTVAYSVTGSIKQDTTSISFFSTLPGFFGGTFKATLHDSGTGQNYYLREGAFRLPIVL